MWAGWPASDGKEEEQMNGNNKLSWEEIRRRIERHFSPEDLAEVSEAVDRDLYTGLFTHLLEEIEQRDLSKSYLEFTLAAILANLSNVQTTRGSIAIQTFLAGLWEVEGVSRYLDWMERTIQEACQDTDFE
jgi:hypothetical protein